MKILVVRFSSIGDVILTTPVVRAIKEQLIDAEIHYLTKVPFKLLLDQNPHIHRIWTIGSSISEVLPELKKEKFDHVIDLHHNARTLLLKWRLGRKAYSFPKMNLQKWLLVRTGKNFLPDVHVVDRYFEAVQKLGVKNDGKPCELFLHPDEEVDVQATFGVPPGKYCCIAIGAQYATKRMPSELLIRIIEKIPYPIVLCGGTADQGLAIQLMDYLGRNDVMDATGRFTLRESASIVKQSAVLLTNDTGLMHIATCFNVRIVSVWGNTVPELGMYPYYPETNELFSIHEVKGLSCRPCSKIGYKQCPKGHFECMYKQDTQRIASDVITRFNGK
ncbi:MAG: glycosyltransferase family 9 protein [Bacteroidota bacterium]|jgi:ADP-heptose:LPS heptosyltransferase